MNNNLTKNKIVKSLFYETGIPTSILEKFLDSLFEEIINNAISNKVMKISNFGSFYVREKKNRIGRNLNTNQDVLISARKTISFYSSNYLKQVINEEV